MRPRYGLLAGLGLALGLGVPLWLGGWDLAPALAQVRWSHLSVLLLMIFVGWNLNAGRVRLLARGTGMRIGHGQALATVMATEFAISATPAGSGGPPTYAWLLRRLGMPAPRALVLYAVDIGFDILFFLSALTALAMHWLLVPADARLAWGAGLLAAMLLGGLALGWLLLRHYRVVLLAVGRVLRRLRVSAERRRRLARAALEFRRSLALVRAMPKRYLAGVYLLCVGHWLLRYSVLYLVVRALGGDLSWSYALLVQMVSLSAGQFTLLPGGSGGAELTGALLLAPYLDPGTAAAAILLWRFVTFYWYLIAGAPVFLMLAGGPLWRRLTAAPAAGVDGE